MKYIFCLLISLFLFSCGTSEQKETDSNTIAKADTVQPTSEKVVQELHFSDVLKTITIANINQFIHPEKGLWLIQSPGAMPNMTKTTQVDKNFPVDFLALKEEELPKVNCDSKSFWTKDGCFAQEVNTFKDEKIWTYCGLKKEDEAKVGESAKAIQYTVINTSLYARYYFGQIDGKWYLLFADLRRPCEA